jgi:hypothetical protein
MNCGICQKDIGEIIVPLPIRQPDGALEVLACLACAKVSAAYCTKHDRPHMGFVDRTTACRFCIEEEVARLTPSAEEIFERILDDLDAEEFEDLLDEARLSSVITGESVEVCLLRIIVTKAQRTGSTVENVIELLLTEQSSGVLLYMPGL